MSHAAAPPAHSTGFTFLFPAFAGCYPRTLACRRDLLLADSASWSGRSHEWPNSAPNSLQCRPDSRLSERKLPTSEWANCGTGLDTIAWQARDVEDQTRARAAERRFAILALSEQIVLRRVSGDVEMALNVRRRSRRHRRNSKTRV